MGSLYRYLLKDFFRTLLTYFGVMFFLVSIIYFVKIAKLTSVMSMNFLDIFQIYFYYLPQIIIYTFPLTYFISLVISLYNFSKDGEMIVLFTLGKSPKSIVNMYLIVSFLITLLLVINSLILMPLSEQSSHNFIKIKKVESKINVRSSEVGQKIGSWHIFTNKADDFLYNDLVLFSSNYKKNEQLILSKSAKFTSTKESVSLTLKDGNHYLIDSQDKIIQTSFKTLKLTNPLIKDELENKSIVEYWSDIGTNKYRSKWFSIYMLLSIFPFLSVFASFSIGVINQRVQKRSISFWMALVVIVYYGVIVKLADSSPMIGNSAFATVFFIINFYVYRKLIIKRY